MGRSSLPAFIVLLYLSGALGSRTKFRRDEIPSFPYDPDTTPYCTWWWDNDGSIPCEDMPATWGISLNPSVSETCGNFLENQSYCVEAFGEPEPTTIEPPTTTTTTTTAGPPGPTQPGQIGTCNRWDLVQTGDSCNTYIQKYPGLTLADLTEWNSEIGAQCQFLWIDYYLEAMAVLEIQGNAEMQYESERLRIIETLSYPGLAIKGIAAIGPTLELYGQMAGYARISGTLTAGARVQFPKYEMYFPQVPEAEEFQVWPSGDRVEDDKITGPQMRPILDASVEAYANLDFKLTPEVNLGIRVNNPLGKNDALMDAQIVGFVNNTLRFEVQGEASGGIDKPPAASYSVFIKYFYNFGITGRAVFKWLGEHALTPLTLWEAPGREIILWEHHGSTASSKRDYSGLDEGAGIFAPLSTNATTSIDDGWPGLREPFVANGGVFDKRATDGGSGADAQQKWDHFFTCNDDNQCASGGCEWDTCEWNPSSLISNSILARQASAATPAKPCVNDVPAFMYNCRYFPDEQKDGRIWPGICKNILTHFKNKGIGSGPFEGTFKMNGSPQEENRHVICGKASKHDWSMVDEFGNTINGRSLWSERCTRQSNVIWQLVGGTQGVAGNTNWLSCDEFPFNSLEQGGNPMSTSRMCVPGYQQQLQSVVNKLPRNVNQRVQWRDSNGVQQTVWKNWEEDWTDTSATSLGAWNEG
ncbi:hypothetical protein BDV12DRAFT_196162 [Aspergillus spectabilis]